MIKITPDEIKVISKYIYDISGIYLDERKAYLIETRLKVIIENEGVSSYQGLYNKAISDRNRVIEKKYYRPNGELYTKNIYKYVTEYRH